MDNQGKSYDELLGELAQLRRRVAELESLELDLKRTQHMESVGILAGGIAHELNNILTAILGNIVLAKMYANPELEVFDILVEAEKASCKAETLAKQLLTFSKGGMVVRKLFSLRTMLEDMTRVGPDFHGTEYDLAVPDGLWAVEGDEKQIRQAISNLLINARQAMPEGGLISVSAENVMPDEAEEYSLKRGEYVSISVRDRGPGIADAHIAKIFEPFFTTKQKGSGLGLAAAYSIISSHDGYMTFDSNPGEGSTFTIYLPAAGDKQIPVHPEERIFLSGKKRVLVMDDEEMVRTVLERMLDQCGCRPDFARDGLEMIGKYEKALLSGSPYDVVIVDLVIVDGMGGKEAIGKLLALDPDAKAIVSSGYSDDPIMAHYKQYGFKGVLSKPYNISELGRILQEVIVEHKE